MEGCMLRYVKIWYDIIWVYHCLKGVREGGWRDVIGFPSRQDAAIIDVIVVVVAVVEVGVVTLYHPHLFDFETSTLVLAPALALGLALVRARQPTLALGLMRARLVTYPIPHSF